jgi:hypothetical protein
VSLTALISRISLYELVNLKFLVFCDIVLKLRICCQPDGNFGAKKEGYFLSVPIIFVERPVTLVVSDLLEHDGQEDIATVSLEVTAFKWYGFNTLIKIV